jgi:tetratricopeptide (TPR) repeat protein
MTGPTAIRYCAFLSYSHRDTAWSKWLQHELERFRIDRNWVGRETPIGPVPKTLRPIFRDREESSGGSRLSVSTTRALDASAALIVLCSTASAKRPAVNEEVRRFRSRHPNRPVIPVIVDDTIPQNLPPALCYELSADGTITDHRVTVLGPDLRDGGDGKSLGLAKVIAGLTGIGSDEILHLAERTRRRRNRFRGALVGIFLLAAVAAGGSAVYAWQQLKTNEAFLDTTLKRVTEIVNVAVVQADKYSMSRAATLAFLGYAESLLNNVTRQGRQTPELNYRRAWMLVQFARNYQILGDVGQQYTRATEAHRLLVGLAAEKLNDTDYQRDLSIACNDVGDVLAAQRSLGEALDSYRNGLAIRTRLAKANPTKLGWLRDLSISYDKIGDVLVAQGNLADALQSFGDGLAVKEQLAKADPANTSLQRELSMSHNKIGDVLVALDNLAEALKSYHSDLAVRQQLAEFEPTNSGWQRDLSASYDKIGYLLMAQGNFANALKSFGDGLSIRERLAKADPTNAGWQRDLWMSYNKVGDALRHQSSLAEALKFFRDGLAVGERLAKGDPANTSWQRHLWMTYNEVGDALVLQGNLAEALISFREGLAAGERLANADPTNASWQRDLWMSYNKLGDALVHQGNLAEALKSFRDGLAIGQRLAAVDSRNAVWQRNLSVSYDKIGEVLVAQGNPGEALNFFREGLAAGERLAKADAANAGWQRDLWMSYNKVGDMLLHQGLLAEALKSFGNGLGIGARLVAANRNNAEWQADLQFSIVRISGLAESLILARDFARALEAADLIHSAMPGTILFHIYRARALMFLGRVDEARVLHSRYRREKNVQNGKSWETLVLEDFAALRKAGLSHPLMNEIERRFGTGR